MLKLRNQIKNLQFKLKIFHSISNNRSLKPSLRWYINVIKSQQRKKFSKFHLKNHCILSGRTRSLYRFARLSRLFLRDPLFIGTLPGLRKSSW
jgi:ribosomal protein S14